MSIAMRQEMERKIVSQFVRDAIAAGKRLAVSLERGYDTADMLLGSTDEKAIMDAAFAGDECHIFVQAADGDTVVDGQVASEGWVFCVMGNDGWDVISDYTTNLEDNGILKNALEIAEKYSG